MWIILATTSEFVNLVGVGSIVFLLYKLVFKKDFFAYEMLV